jgi:hypothetical protein
MKSYLDLVSGVSALKPQSWSCFPSFLPKKLALSNQNHPLLKQSPVA